MSTVNQEVTLKIDDSFTGPVCDYSVGFLKFRQQGKIEVADPMVPEVFAALPERARRLEAAVGRLARKPQSTVFDSTTVAAEQQVG